MNLPTPPYPIVAAGVCPQGLSPGQTAPNVTGCKVTNGGTGTWQVTALDPTILPSGPCALIAFPGNGSNIAKGISFGQASATGVNGLTQFLFQIYRNDTGAAVDVEAQFIIVRWPTI